MSSIPSIPNTFSLTRVLKVDLATGTLALLGTLPRRGTVNDKSPAVLVVHRLPFPSEPEALSALLRDLSRTELNESNDIYSWFQAKSGEEYNDLKLSLIYPATEMHIRKHSAQPMEMMEENMQMYKEVIEPYIRQLDPSRTQWVRNILQGQAEVDRVLYSDPDPQEGFVILPDFKWDQVNLTGLYLQVIARDASLASIRDLRGSHLPFLKKIERIVYQVVHEHYGLRPSQCRLFFHYHPSYYHLHLHVTHVENALVGGAYVGRAHLLQDVQESLRLCPDYYARATLTYILGHDHPLYPHILQQATIIKNREEERKA